jgi:aminoglycoside phosphotransferase (APT) family kinase protein
VLREFRVMRGLRQSPLPVPEPILSCADPSVIGAPFFLMEDLAGDAIRFELPVTFATVKNAPRAIAEHVVDALATLHTTDPAGVGLADLSKPTGYIERQVRLWQGQLDYARVRPVPDLDWTSRWLAQNLPGDVARPSLVHGDYKLDNVIFSCTAPPRLLGVVDWEMAALGDPLADLGWLLAFWCEGGTPPPELTILPRITELPTFPRRAELAERYAWRVGRELPDLRFYVVLALWKMAVLLEAHWARHVRGTAGTFDFTYLERGGPILAAYIRHVVVILFHDDAGMMSWRPLRHQG